MKRSEAGNAVIFILLAIFLFAALAFSFLKSGQSSTGNLSANQAKLAASEILGYADNVSRGVDKLRQRGCGEKQLNFVNTYNANANPLAPATHECDIFDAAGAGIVASDTQAPWFRDAGSKDIFYFTGSDSIQDIGTTCTTTKCSELSINIWELSLQVCNELNKQLGLNLTTVPTNHLQGCPFKGTYDCDGDGSSLVGFNIAALKGKKAVCYNDTSEGYSFNYVILER